MKFTLLNLLTCEDDTSPTNCPGAGPDGVSPTSVGGEYVVELKSGDSTVWTTPELGYDDRAAGQGRAPKTLRLGVELGMGRYW